MQVAIIGCGVVGATIAYELSLVKGVQVTLFDQNTPASGSTHAALGVLMGVISHKTKGRAWKLRERSMQRYTNLLPELEAITGKEIPYNRQGIIKLGFGEEDLNRWSKLVATRRNQGWNLELWSREKLQTQCPHIQDQGIIGAVYSPQDLQINPTALTEALVAAAQINGVTCHFGVKAENCTTKGGNCLSLQTNAGKFELDWLILSAGLGSTPLTVSLAEKIDIRPVIGQAMHVKVDHTLGKPQFQPVISGNDIHIVPVGQQEYWIGATVEFPDSEGGVVADSSLLEQVYKQAIAFCPALADATILSTWSGKRPRPEGMSAPILGKLTGYNNILLATGHYRNGVLLAPASAEIIKNLALNV